MTIYTDLDKIRQRQGDILKRERKKLKARQIDICFYAKISKRTISNIEKGDVNCTLNSIEAYKLALVEIRNKLKL